MVAPFLCLSVNGIVKAPVNPFTDHLANLLTATVFLNPTVYVIHDDHHLVEVQELNVTEAAGGDGNILRTQNCGCMSIIFPVSEAYFRAHAQIISFSVGSFSIITLVP